MCICICVIVASCCVLGYRGYFIIKDKLNTDEYTKIRDSIKDDITEEDTEGEGHIDSARFPTETETESELGVGDGLFEVEEKEKKEDSVALKFSLGKLKGKGKKYPDIPKKFLKDLKTDRSPKAIQYCKKLLSRLRKKYKNKDIIGYIKLINKDLEYPVLQGETNDTYLHAGPDKSYDYNGSIFLDYGNTPDFLDTRSVIYGHNMRNGSMFGNLRNFYSESIDDSYFLIYTDAGIYVYKIFSFATINARGGNYYCHPEKQYKEALMTGKWDRRADDPDKDRTIHVDKIGIYNEEDAELIAAYDGGLKEFYDKVKSKAMLFDKDFKFDKSNRYVTLMTCYGDGKTERLAVSGYLVFR